MNRAAWHTRIQCGNAVGSGFLVSARQVVTCAHVVAASGTSAVTVGFPHRADLGELTARVAVHGGWRGGATDPGDVAVLELERDVPITPAVFAPAGAGRGTTPAPALAAYGFPRGHDEGSIAHYHATRGPLIAGEWVQLEAVSVQGQPLAEGFSGAAVQLPDGSVVGMVTAIAGGREARVGRMLPTEVMARYWHGLGELVPTPDLTPAQLRELYELVGRAEREGRRTGDHDRLYVDAVGPFGPDLPAGGFGSLTSLAVYLQLEVPEAVPQFLVRLRELLDGAESGCGEAGKPGTTPRRPPGRAPAWSPIVVEIDHSGAGPDQVTVEVSAYREGRRRPVGARRLPWSGVRAYVQEHIDQAVTQLAPGADELLAFILPRGWLNWPVARWECGADDPTPLGCAYPLVVADRARHRSGRMRHQLHKKWQKLDGGPAAVHRIDCGIRERPSTLRKRLWDDGTDLVGFASPPDAAREHFEVGLTVPVPMLLWPRAGCPEPDHEGPCGRGAFLDALTASVAGVPPADLPHHLLSLRLAADAHDEVDGHWAGDVQLLWDDPRCFPETPAPLHSPVA
ncbi:trypsin-like peptidase domain-containing protein [Streptomyces sp. NPDC047860]|uniref:VMAP-C domain-containing protein n=1 Tax=Streptomyces sp. NPDC047860 TaxID=3155743 RepID=UPI003400C295